ncbi:DUF3095 domain-containing protein [Rhizobium sp. YJ-22]|uniref:DUF3095 domain-containing protein n=1 Tax=Rhizobium sp. YJ-22 TaxID=3037556 RepID=UPI0024126C25|nr:DUF3095 domain-containing protein [Rhizobium sp. YJ-22]MDG3578898.1 DUF3095 domain-containing protein [Rhizobium sp. YJ-22]
MVATHEAERFEAPVFHRFEGVTEIGNYAPLPDGWWLAVADIVDSTGAIDAGRYKDVNMAGASVISGVLNALGRDDLPFVFGGDGALVALPPSGAAAATQALASTRRWTLEQLGLSMRAAMVPVTAAREAGQDVRVARFRPSEFVTYAMFAGGGASWAERQMKAGRFSVDLAPIGEKPDLTGLSCRWNPIRSRHGVIASIIAVPDEAAADSDFRGLVGDILGLAGGAERAGHPVPEDGPAPGLSHAGMMLELKADRLPGLRLRHRLVILVQAALVRVLTRTGLPLGSFDAGRYRRDIATNSDFRKFDDGLKMTLDIDRDRLARIAERLERASEAGICRYGVHMQEEALMTCLVPTPLQRDHMHFIDGASGGYAAAALDLKRKAAALTP